MPHRPYAIVIRRDPVWGWRWRVMDIEEQVSEGRGDTYADAQKQAVQVAKMYMVQLRRYDVHAEIPGVDAIAAF